jgi:hypothetical protein
MKKIPVWVLVIAGFLVLVPLVSVILQYIDPTFQFSGYDAAALSLAGPFGMYLSRKLATALIMAIALFKREPGMLTCAFLFVLFTYMLDIINILVGRGEVSVLTVVLIVLTVPALWKLWPMIKVRK